MTKAFGWITGSLGAAGAAVAIFLLPWAHYGQLDIRLHRFPGWGYYVSAAVALNLLAGWALIAPAHKRRLLLYVGTVMSAITVGAAVVTILRYDDAGVFFGEVIPLVVPSLGSGGPVAIVAVLLSTAALFSAPRHLGTATRTSVKL